MAKCEICERGQKFGIQVSHSHRRSNRAWKPNVKKTKMTIDGVTRRMFVCTSCMRSNKKSV
ncbi:MAG: 50S ribosomal protein L28 [Clostridiaceae bacterium]|jgi:large subunit ribosomal protein L28|nr:50S ribosomal protein L28 [Clostridiaceae bacterium]